MKKSLKVLMLLVVAVMLTACGKGKDNKKKNRTSELKYHFATKEEAASIYLSNDAYFDGFSQYDIQYRTQKKDGTIEELKEFGAAQMEDFTDEEKAGLEKTLAEMQADLKDKGLEIPDIGEITFIKSTQKEECGSGAYTHGTYVFLSQYYINNATSESDVYRKAGKMQLWHEIFHCFTRKDSDFRKDMYKIIHFKVQDKEYELPPSVASQYISNPDVEHHNAYATFKIDGKDIDCYTVLIATKPFEKKGDSFMSCMGTALVPVDGSDTYYLPEDAENFWDIFGGNTAYVIDPEECLADNFGYALTYGMNDWDYITPEIIKSILDYLSK